LDNSAEFANDNFKEDLKAFVIAKGELQYGAKGEEEFDSLYGECHEIAQSLLDLQDGRTEDKKFIEIKLPEQKVLLSGNIERVYGSDFIPYHLGSNKFKHIFTQTINYLALSSEQESKLTYLSKEKGSIKVFQSVNKCSSEMAIRSLESLISLYLKGMKKPLPFIASCFEAFLKGKDIDDAIERSKKAWYPSYNNNFSPSSDEANILCFGSDFPGENKVFEEDYFESFEVVKRVFNSIWQEVPNE